MSSGARGLARRVEPSEIESVCDREIQLAEDVQRAGMQQVVRIVIRIVIRIDTGQHKAHRYATAPAADVE